jgi:hypothetical protein
MIMKRINCKRQNLMAALAGVLLLLFMAGICTGQSPSSESSALAENGPEGCSACGPEKQITQIDTESGISEPIDSASIEALPDSGAKSDKLNAAPGPATLVSPSGTISSGSPTYVWDRVIGTQYYALEVNNSLNAVVIKQWYNGTDTTGSETPTITLAAGTYKWRILAWNCDGYSWSSANTFTVCSSTTLPGKATLISPKGTIGTAKPTYQWKTVNGATRYHLKVSNINDPNNPVIYAWYDASEVVDGLNCYIKPDTALAQGSYKWWIQTGNCNTEGPWSNYATFKFANVSPGRPSTISPSGLVSTSSPTFIWTAVKNAAGYYLHIENDTSTVYDLEYSAEEVTSGSRARARLPAALPNDQADYYWRVQAYNDAGTGSWSSLRHFELVCRG